MQYNTADQFHTNIVNISFKQERGKRLIAGVWNERSFKATKGREIEVTSDIPEQRKFFKVIVNGFKIKLPDYHLKAFLFDFFSFCYWDIAHIPP